MNRALLLGMVVLGAAFGAGGMWVAERVAPGDLGVADRTRVERIVRDYVLANPEIIPQAMQKLQDRETGKAIDASRSAIETPVGSAWAGNPKGDVTVVEYFDYNCGYCRAILPTIDKLIAADPQVRVVFRELPVLSETSRDAARVSIAAAEQGRFKPFHDALYAAGPVTAQTIAAAATRAGVKPATSGSTADEELRANLAIASKLGMTGTPSWVIGDQVLSGALPLDQLRDAVAAARAR